MKRARQSEGYGIFRLVMVAILALGNILVTIAIMVALTRLASFIEAVFLLIALLLVLRMMITSRTPDYTLAWAVILLCVPVAGLVLFFSWGNVSFTKNERGYLELSSANVLKFLKTQPDSYEELAASRPELARQAAVLNSAGYPVCNGGSAEYLPLGEVYFESLIKDLNAAQDFIFMSYYIMSLGHFWDEICDILVEKVKQGVTVRVMYDDFGCVRSLPRRFSRALKEYGIEVAVFNPIHRYVRQLYMYYRNHQKICVIDGKIAYVGGVNIADEYINRIRRFGHWKDTGLKVTGGAVNSVTAIFLQMWDVVNGKIDTDIKKYMPEHETGGDCYMIPFADGPSSKRIHPAHDIYLSMCQTAQRSVWYTTPYLTPDCPLREALCLAARSGVDVRIITPGIPDHITVYAATRGHYQKLLNSGVRIFEYEPGFMHAKMVLCDRKSAIVGSINMDTRSFYQEYENAVWLYGSPAVEHIAEDFDDILSKCREIKRYEWAKRPVMQRFREAVLFLMSPLF